MSRIVDRRSGIRIAPAAPGDRERIARLRHEVYARELGQHPINPEGRLGDPLDAHNVYLTASSGGDLLGFVSITPPGAGGYSIDKYLSPAELPFPRDEGLYEVRLLTVAPAHRHGPAAALLMMSALRWVEARGGKRIVAIGRRELLPMYRKAGLSTLGREVRSGRVSFELMAASIGEIRARLDAWDRPLRRVLGGVDWRLDVPPRPAGGCEHGGAFWTAIGEEFEALHRKDQVLNADVLDAWFPPAPGALAALSEHLPWLARTSPPTGSEGLIRAIARARGIEPRSILPGDGSSSLIFLAFRRWLSRSSRALVLDPTYGEYVHVLEKVVRCRVDRVPLAREDGYQLHLEKAASLLDGQDLLVLVNSNSPTGRHVPRAELERFLEAVPSRTRVWVDETYLEYAAAGESLEPFAARSPHVVVAKSMSKVYALSGLRAAYLCAAPHQLDGLREAMPPWAVSLPAQVAAVMALRDPDYYAGRWRETRLLREELARGLEALGLWVVPGEANFLMCHLDEEGPSAAEVCERCRARGVFLRDLSGLSARLGRHALRVAVKDAAANHRLLQILAEALGATAPPTLLEGRP